MSAQSPRNPTSTTPASGRHRRPESLADVEAPVGARPAVTALFEVPRRRADPRNAGPASQTRSARHQRPRRGGRHAARVPAPRGGSRPPVTGSHRAPGTLPIESWLLMGKTRQQALLASLVAVGVLLLAVPAEQRRDGIDAVNAAAQAVAGVQAEPVADEPPAPRRSAAAVDRKEQRKPESKPAPPAAAPPASARPVATPTRRADAATDLGPGASLRTTGSRVVSLTFDDGPDPVQTPRILALLGKYDVKAVFCLVGTQVQRHPDIVRDIVAAGHTLCNHTWDHSLRIGRDEPEQIRADLARTNEAIRAAAPGADVPFFRAPGGNFTERLVQVAGGDGMTSLYWQVDPRDWDHTDDTTDGDHVDRVVAQIRDQVRPGSIVLSHDFGQPDTVAAYEKLLPWLADNFTLGLPRQVVDREPTTPPATDGPEPTDTPSTPAPSESPAAGDTVKRPAGR